MCYWCTKVQMGEVWIDDSSNEVKPHQSYYLLPNQPKPVRSLS